ncbi:TadG family pilus assembly protein [Aestuariivirga sp.]|uniref:TadG family pilus assembly protein n=1 Tax=Aestuariivirga sp. TaxID=2650926 RepID=UPI0039E27AC0
MRRSVRAFLRDSGGNIAILAALCFPVCVAATGLGVDEGSIYLEKTNLQSVTDLAAIVAASNIDKAEKAASQAFKDNGFVPQDALGGGGIVSGEANDSPVVSVQRGHYSADTSVPVAQRFTNNATPYNAVRVDVSKPATLYFQAMFRKPPTIKVSGIASTTPEAAFSIGSRLAQADGGIANGVLGGLLGTSLSLSVMDYNALLSSRVNVLSFMDALASEMNIRSGTYNDLLSANATMGQFGSALADVTGDQASVNTAVRDFGRDAKYSSVTIPLSHMFDLGSSGNLRIGQGSAALDATANVMDLITSAVTVADGTHQATVNLGATLPGLAATSLTVAIGEPPQHSPSFTVGGTGSIVRTAQTRLRLIATIGGSGVLNGLSIRLPLYLQLAYGEATVSSVTCPGGQATHAMVNLAVTPGVADTWIGEVSGGGLADFTSATPVSKATLIDASLVKVTGQAHVNIGSMYPQTVPFDASDIAANKVKTVSSNELTQSLTASLVSNLDLSVQLGGLSLLSTGAVTASLKGTLSSVTPTLDSAVNTILALAGAKVGSADVWIDGVRCRMAVLVQ